MVRFSFALALITVAGFAQADLKSDLKASRQKLEKAVLAKDAKGVEAVMTANLTPDFKYMQDGKAQDRKTFIGEFVATLAMMEKISSSSEQVLSLTQKGDTATGKIEHLMKGTMKAGGKKTQSIDWTGLFTEQYRKVGGKWKTCGMTAGPQKFLVDGKPVKM